MRIESRNLLCNVNVNVIVTPFWLERPVSEKVTYLPRPRAVRPVQEPLGLYVRVSRNDHKELLNLLSAGVFRCFGVVVDAVHADRHKELREHVLEHRLDAILDPKTQAAATVGGYTPSMGRLPWGLDRVHRVSDFQGRSGKQLMAKLGDFTIEQGFTQVLAPTHLLQDASDPWLARDIEATAWLRAHLDRSGGSGIPLIYSLAIPYRVFRDVVQRRLLIETLRGIPVSALWLKVDGFGSTSTPAAARTYIDAATDFHQLGIPVIGDHVGGLVGLGLLAFGAVGGIAHGVTMHERFDASPWRRRSESGTGWTMPRRVFIPGLDLMLKPEEARLLLEVSPRARSLFGCRDSHCCPRGVRDMLDNSARHFLYRRMEDVAALGQAPESLRVPFFLDRHLRPSTDLALAAANVSWPDEAMAKKTREQRKRLDALRVALSHYYEANPPQSFASAPLRRAIRKG